jgi:MFS family permease
MAKISNLRCYAGAGVILSALAMSVGWGIRGDYGHEAGAMIPGALLGLAICLASGRADWWQRCTIMAMCGAIGWAFGGQISYGQITGYTACSSLLDVTYGYGCLFLIGGLWAGIGSAILTLSVTQPRSYLERFAGPLVVFWLVRVFMDLTGLTAWMVQIWYANDTDWFAALSALLVAGIYALIVPCVRPACALIAALAGGWWAGYLSLTCLLGLHMTPPRSDNWAGCVGLFAALLAYLYKQKDHAAFALALYGFLAGGIGFAAGDFVNMLGRTQAGPIGHYKALQGLDYWKWMEQLFGLIMGLGVSLAFLRYARAKLTPPAEDQNTRNLNTVGLLFLLLVMMWSNLSKNVRNWSKGQHIPEQLFGIGIEWWFLPVAVCLSAMVVIAIVRYRRQSLPLAPSSSFGRAQLLFMMLLWIPIIGALLQAFPGMASKGVFFVHTTFWITGGLCSIIVLSLSGQAWPQPEQELPASGCFWKPGVKYWIALLLVPLFVLLLAYLTVASHKEPLFGSHLRFMKPSQR